MLCSVIAPTRYNNGRAPDAVCRSLRMHYVDLASAVLGLTLLPMGYLMHAISKNSDSVVKKREM